MPTERQKQKQQLARFFDCAGEVQGHFYVKKLKEVLPPAWDEIDQICPIEPPKTKVTLRLETEVLEFFRKQGPRYQAQINLILRTYVAGRLSQALRRREDGETMEEIFYGQRLRTYEEMVADHKAEEKGDWLEEAAKSLGVRG